MKTTDFVLRELKKLNVKHVFGITGGAISNQLDAFSRSDIKFITTQHEQAAAMAADAYSRINGYGVVMATSGPGGTNAITGIACSWFDSVPVLIITGQVSTFDLRTNQVRQRGFQEVDMVKAMTPFVKFSHLVTKADDLPDILEKAVQISLSGRPGPVHLDIPMDVQQADIKPRNLKFFPKLKSKPQDFSKLDKLLSQAKRPVLIVGNGCRNYLNDLSKLCHLLKWPVLPSWGMVDFCTPYRIEQFGVYGNRGANFSVQNSDLILSIGCRLDTRMTGSNPRQFAREAKKIIVDIDHCEIDKGIAIPDLKYCMDAGDFIRQLSLYLSGHDYSQPQWLKTCLNWSAHYQIIPPKTKMINAYTFLQALSSEIEHATIIPDCSSNMAMAYQTIKPFVVIPDTGSSMSQSYQTLKSNIRMFTAMGNSPMGYSLPAAIGAGLLKRNVIAIIGDGGVQMNIQEFQTIKNYNVPLKLFIFSNKGYALIRQFQDLYMGGRHIGTQEGTPDFEKVAKSYGLKSFTIRDPKKMKTQIRRALKMRQVIVNVIMDPDTPVSPRAIFGKPIEEQHPFLPDKELKKNLLVKRWGS